MWSGELLMLPPRVFFFGRGNCRALLNNYIEKAWIQHARVQAGGGGRGRVLVTSALHTPCRSIVADNVEVESEWRWPLPHCGSFIMKELFQ